MTFKEKMPLGGIKFSEERVHYAVSRPHSAQATTNDFLQDIHKKQINIPFLCHTNLAGSSKTCFCVSIKDVDSISEILHYPSNIKLAVTTHNDVGSVTIFPHKKDLTFIAIVMSLMESLALPVYSSCTSISAFVFNTDISALQTIAMELTAIFELPDNHSPFHPEFQLRQPRSSIAP